LKAAHIHDEVLNRKTLLKRGQENFVVSSEITTFGSNLLPFQVFKLKATTPIPNNSFIDYQPTIGVDTLTYNKEASFYYDMYRNINRIWRSGVNYSFLWKHGNPYLGGFLPVAKIDFALPQQIYYTSFEENGTAGISATGEKHFVGSTFTIPEPERPVAPNLRMTFWYFDGVWKLQNEIPYTPTISVSGATAYDEVRVFPANAQMSTYTIHRFNGTTTATDLNNTRTKYEFDLLGRLKLVRDNNGNIVSKSSYHFKGQLPNNNQ
jgi:YD repeat-containing protein